jgi:hypothetical protein
MAGFVFRCPNKDQHVQGWSAEDVSDDGDTYVPVRCTACRRVHHVNLTNGKVLGGAGAADDE